MLQPSILKCFDWLSTGANVADNESVAFREIRRVDYDALASFFEANNLPDIVRYFRPFPLIAETAFNIVDQPHRDRFFIASKKGQIVGFSMLRGWDEGYTIPSFGILVDYRFQGQGIGNKLTKFTIDQAVKLNCEKVRLSVHLSNTVALKMYESFGFYESSREKVMVGEEPDIKIIMLKDLIK